MNSNKNIYTFSTNSSTNQVNNSKLLWLISMFFPIFLPLTGIATYIITQNVWTLAIPFIFGYFIMPLLDMLIGEDTANYSENIMKQLESDPFYRILSYLVLLSGFSILLLGSWFVTTYEIGIIGFIAAAIFCGISNGITIIHAHELGHKKNNSFEHIMARLALAIPCYPHFTIAHNKGHHKWVATPEDNASSRLGESIYKFAFREIIGVIKEGVALEKIRLNKKQKSFFSSSNTIIQSLLVSFLLYATLVYFFGLLVILFIMIHNLYAWFQLTSQNYVTHYGLLRDKKPNGLYESPKPHHSWNSNHILSGLTLLNLERHSDHHAYPTRPYQILRNFHNIPRLPNGYYGMFVIAYIPSLWFKIMDKRVLNLSHIKGDLSKVNIDPDSPLYTK